MESVLDEANSNGFPSKMLLWHYRSRHESLISFSNWFFYDNRLNTFPSSYKNSNILGIEYRLIENGVYDRGKSRKNIEEAGAVAGLVMEHFRRYPEYSLGVVTFSEAQQMCILEMIEELRWKNPEMEDFFSDHTKEPFFVKNLENVQGDERDVIFFSLGYAKDHQGKLSLNFGPLNKEGGHRRLNVAITRARYHIKWVSSIRSIDIDLSRTKSKGTELLKTYMDYAEKGGDPQAIFAQSNLQRELDSDSPFEREVFKILEEKNIDVHTQVGCAGYRIDLAVVDPQHPGRYILGIECDGASYHSSRTARDRDRLREEILIGLGWNIHRIWSRDWMENPQKELNRLLEVIEKAKQQPSPMPSLDSEETLMVSKEGAVDEKIDTPGPQGQPLEEDLPLKKHPEKTFSQKEIAKESVSKGVSFKETVKNPSNSQKKKETVYSAKEKSPELKIVLSEKSISKDSAKKQSISKAPSKRQIVEYREYKELHAKKKYFDVIPTNLDLEDESKLLTILVDIVEVESPIHIDLATRRFLNSHGHKNPSKKWMKKEKQLIDRVAEDRSIIKKGAFLWSPSMIEPPIRKPDPLQRVRQFSWIAPEEIQQAFLYFVSERAGIARKELFKSLLSIFEIPSSKKSILDSMERELEFLIESQQLYEVDSSLFLRKTMLMRDEETKRYEENQEEPKTFQKGSISDEELIMTIKPFPTKGDNMKKEVIPLLERIPEFEEDLEVDFKGLYVTIDVEADGVTLEEGGSIDIRGELHSRLGKKLKQNMTIEAVSYDKHDQVIHSTDTDVPKDEFRGFQVFHLMIESWEVNQIPKKIRLYPKES